MIPSPFDLLPKTATCLHSVRKGEYLFRYGDPTVGLFVSLDTEIHLSRTGQDGQMILIHRASAGTWFAEASLFSDKYQCDAFAQKDGEVLQISKAAVLSGFGNANFAATYCRVLSVQVQNMRQLREILAVRSAEERVFAGLVARLHVGTVVDYAATLSLTPEATYRALRRLVEQGRVENPGRGVYHLKDSQLDRDA